LLREVARRFRLALRDQDLMARLGGDEFAVGLFDISSTMKRAWWRRSCSLY
jgi:GGDEF domain-containing protein